MLAKGGRRENVSVVLQFGFLVSFCVCFCFCFFPLLLQREGSVLKYLRTQHTVPWYDRALGVHSVVSQLGLFVTTTGV